MAAMPCNKIGSAGASPHLNLGSLEALLGCRESADYKSAIRQDTILR
jgi:hypothetical protein